VIDNAGGGKILSARHNGVEKLRVDGSGNVVSQGGGTFAGAVGIGTITPAFPLDINGGTTNFKTVQVVSSGNDSAISLKNTNTTTGLVGREYWIDSGANTAGVGAGNFGVWDNTAGAARFVIDPKGEVGIGTTTPSAAFEVINGGTASSTQLTVIAGIANATSATANLTQGVFGESDSTGRGAGVVGYASQTGTTTGTYGVFGEADGPQGVGVYGSSSKGFAGHFDGNVDIIGNLTVTGTVSKGGGSFKIDHPLDPEHKYLSHSFVESPDMMNIYNGDAVLDARGRAWVKLPGYFQALNMDFRYQLTCIGGWAPVFIAREIDNNRFEIAGGKRGTKVSWQVTGVRHDPYANAHPIKVEEEKPVAEQGTYLHPDAYGRSETKGAAWARLHRHGAPAASGEVTSAPVAGGSR